MECSASDCHLDFSPRASGGNPQLYCCRQCKERAVSQIRFRADPEAVRGANRKSYWRHRDRLLRERRARYTLNLEWEHARSSLYGKHNRDKSRFRGKRYALRKRVSFLDPITSAEWDALKTAWDFRCAYCKKIPDVLTQDHVIPISKGGEDSMDNIIPACLSCNKRKSNLDLAEFLWRLKNG